MGEIQATPLGTASFFQGGPVHAGKQKMFDGLTVSALGVGTSLGASDEATDKQYQKIFVQAALGGINFFDTAIYYRGARSERALGMAIAELAEKGVLRDQLVIATKGGLFPYDGPEEGFGDYLREQFLDRGIVKDSDIASVCNCMSPLFLENQIESSLKNLGLACIDLYYINNPEAHLTELGEEKFYQRLTKAFEFLESRVQEKKIARYGLSTWNGFRQKKGALQLAKLVQTAESVAGKNHHFKAIELPLNLVMLEAMSVKNQLFGKEKKSVLDADLGLSLMISSPLMQSKVSQLCSKVYAGLPPEETRIRQALQFILSMPQVCTAFVGMKEMQHLEENRKALLSPPWQPAIWKEACTLLGIK